ncbi:MAG TPA: hypothetical protein DCZ95_18290 [Verrucomicrobia bacterium]|nr:hypothetical protein [Verrucomicrobiota bacterium]
MDDRIVEFEGWEKVLKDTAPVTLQAEYREAVVKFRYWLWAARRKTTVEAFKEHLAWNKSYLSSERYEIRQQSLRWYYDKGRKAPAGNPAVARGVEVSAGLNTIQQGGGGIACGKAGGD